MKLVKIFSILFFSIAISQASFAQTQKESIAVAGNCGMCKSNIEKAAKGAGATSAEWNADTKTLAVSYPSNITATKIQQAIAAVGYDTRDVKAADAAYDKLHACCKYERTKSADSKPVADKKDKEVSCSKDCKKDGKTGTCCESH